MNNETQALEALALALAEKVRQSNPRKASLRLVHAPTPPLFDSITRNCMLTRIRRLQKAYGLQMIVEQATFNRCGLDVLEDAEISALLQQMERARECLAEGMSFDDAGLIRNVAEEFPAD